MKWLITFACIVFSAPAFAAVIVNGQAQDDQAAAKSQGKAVVNPRPGVTIIDGKKFFSLQNAKHFTGGTPPSGLSVLHHPRPRDGSSGTVRHSTPLPATTAGGSDTTKSPEGNDVLSVFAPDEKTISPAVSPAATITPTKQ